MSTATERAYGPVPREEIERRIAEYRAIGFRNRSPAIAVYAKDHEACPWSGCDFVIKGVAFLLEKMGDSQLVDRLLDSWWSGPGLVGACPGCGRPVLFRMNDKVRPDPTISASSVRLPEDWY